MKSKNLINSLIKPFWMAKNKNPSFQFYPGDWRKDQNLSRATLQAKGALIEVMCLAFECEKRGVLKTGKHPWSIDEIAHAIGGDKEANISAIKELIALKVLKIDKNNAVFSSRMVRDEKLRRIRSVAGSKGGNPNLLIQSSKQKTTPSSSSSSSSSTTAKAVEAKSDDSIFQIFRRSASKEITDRQLWEEVRKFKIKYPGKHPGTCGNLINAWVSNMDRTYSLQNSDIQV